MVSELKIRHYDIVTMTVIQNGGRSAKTVTINKK